MDKEKAPEREMGQEVNIIEKSKEINIITIVFCDITLSGFTLSDEIGSSGVTAGQQLPFCILAAKFTKVPAGFIRENMIRENLCSQIQKTS